ncbi:MAG: hypothetical protein QOK25_1696 [Thermoleophilaceae bacterium]|nr:hypothetical protein [Thermoleophilaceae bacterium]
MREGLLRLRAKSLGYALRRSSAGRCAGLDVVPPVSRS